MKYCTECAFAEDTYVGDEKILTCYIARYKDVSDSEACESFRPIDSEYEE